MNFDIPDRHFRRGVALLRAGHADLAVGEFQKALAAEKRRGVLRPTMRYLSFLGLGMARAYRATPESLRLCEAAADKDSFDPALQLNLGRVYLLANRRVMALKAFLRGLALEPGNRELRRALAEVDRRARPVIPVLSRDHAVNRSLGRLRASLFARRA